MYFMQSSNNNGSTKDKSTTQMTSLNQLETNETFQKYNFTNDGVSAQKLESSPTRILEQKVQRNNLINNQYNDANLNLKKDHKMKLKAIDTKSIIENTGIFNFTNKNDDHSKKSRLECESFNNTVRKEYKTIKEYKSNIDKVTDKIGFQEKNKLTRRTKRLARFSPTTGAEQGRFQIKK